MKTSSQDLHYLTVESDAFHERNHGAADPSRLRDHKREILAHLNKAGVKPKRMLEFGCAYGDLLNHYAAEHGTDAFGIEPSAKAVELGNRSYPGKMKLIQGTIADNPVSADEANNGSFDLVIVDDVFCWVSRETLFQSIANIDALLADNGFLYIKEFLPLHQSRNPNHHVSELDVFCYKPRGPHMAMFTASGVYEVVYQEITLDAGDGWVQRQGKPPFESRWSNVVLRKSLNDYFA
jgi:SAM-dependent methyltransferase